MEALILTLDVVCMVYLFWLVFKFDPKSQKGDLGWFAYSKDDDA